MKYRHLISLWCLPALLWAGPREDTEYTRLLQEYGSAIPTAANVTVGMVEWSSSTWSPTPTSGRTFVYPYAPYAGDSAHANIVAQHYYGSNSSSPGIPTVYSLKSDDWMLQHLQIFSSAAPLPTPWEVENHSWIGSIGGGEHWVLQASDFRVNRDNVLVVAGLNNNTDPVPPLVGQFFNGLVVGRTSGSHSRGGTNNPNEIPGRLKPDIIGPAGWTSYATPLVGSAGALLISKTKTDSSLSAARNVRAIKAILLAGASKDRWPAWSNSPTQPLDPVWGAGMVNVYRSWHILTAGRQAASSSSLRSPLGWDIRTKKPGSSQYYYIEVPAGQTTELSLILTWNRELSMGNGREYPYTLENLDLRLWNVHAGTYNRGSLYAESRSSKDNVEHIFVRNLPAGRYAFEVLGGSRDVQYAIAWHTHLQVAPTEPAPETVSIHLLSPSANQVLELGESLEISASLEGTPQSVQWLVNGALVQTRTASPWTHSWTPAAEGSYSVAMQAIDAAGVTHSTAARSVTVERPPLPAVPVTLALSTGATTVQLGETVTLAPGFPEGSSEVALVEFRENNVLIGTSSQPPFTLTWTPATAGTRNLAARTVNFDAVTSDSSVLAVEVTAPPPALEISLVSPSVGSSVLVDVSLAVSASVSDPARTAKVEFLVNGAVIDSTTVTPYETALIFQQAGTYTLTARATCDTGCVVTSSGVSVTVTEPEAEPAPLLPPAEPAPLPDTDPIGDPEPEVFTSQDIGNVGLAGSTVYDPATDTFTVKASGADIWNSTDQFHFVHTEVTGDFVAVVQVQSLIDTDPWAKAGLMLRESLAANSRHGMIIVTPRSGVSRQWRASTGGSSSHSTRSGVKAPVWLKLEREGNQLHTAFSLDGETWTSQGTTTLSLPETAYLGLAVTSHTNSRITTAVFQDLILVRAGETPSEPAPVSEPTPEPEPAPAPTPQPEPEPTPEESGPSGGINAEVFTSQDIGNVGLAGSAEYDSSTDTFTIRASGADIWNSSDQFRFAHTLVKGDFKAIVQVLSLEDTDSWAKAGLMLRESLTANSRHGMVVITPRSGVSQQWRTSTGGSSSHRTVSGQKAPIWLRLEREGNLLITSYSYDREHWTALGEVTLSLPSEAYLGLAVTSHDNSRITTAVFQDLVITQGKFVSDEEEEPIQEPVTAPEEETLPEEESTASDPILEPTQEVLTARDIGNVGIAGSTSYEPARDRIVVSASGADIWNSADQFRFVSREVTGNFEAVVQVLSLTNVHSWAKAGIMVRESLSTNSRHGMIVITPGNGVSQQWRSATGGSSSHSTQSGVKAPVWVKLIREGSLLRTFYSTDGIEWIQRGSVTISLPETVEVGLAVTSHTNSALTEAIFEDFEILPRP